VTPEQVNDHGTEGRVTESPFSARLLVLAFCRAERPDLPTSR
jgi:hypothetical protein